MLRLERAIEIRNKILAWQKPAWAWEKIGSTKCFSLRTPLWQASLMTVFERPPNKLIANNCEQACLLVRARARELPNTLDVWVSGQRKVLSIEWGDKAARLISMQPGKWEQELFALPQELPK